MSPVDRSPPEQPPAGRESRRPSDLGTGEHDVASWLGRLDRAEPPSGLGNDLVGSWKPPLVRRVGRGRGTLAALAVAGVAVAVAVVFSLAARNAGDDDHAQSHQLPPPARVLDDPDVPLYRDLETFRNLDLVSPEDGDLLAGGDGR